MDLCCPEILVDHAVIIVQGIRFDFGDADQVPKGMVISASRCFSTQFLISCKVGF